MGLFGKLFKGPEIDMEKSRANAEKMRVLFDHVVKDGADYRLIFGYTEDVSRFNYGFVHGSKTKIGNLIVGWNEASQTIVVVPTVPDLSGCGEPTWRPTATNIPPMRSSFTRTRKDTSPSMPTTGWRMSACTSMCRRSRSWRLLPTSL